MDGDDGLYTKPQQRLTFELAYEALQDALIAPSSLRGSATAIVVAANGQDGYNQVIEERMDPHKAHRAKGWAPGTHGSSIAGRLAHHLGTEGPCMAVETACSGGLAALNVAVSALERDECYRAIVIGVTTRLVDHHIDYLHTANMASKTGRSSPFGRDADGMVTSEGVVAVVLQRADASSSASAPSSYGAIRSILVRHQGTAANISMTKTDAQSRLHLDALRRAGAMPGDVSVFEAHGTG
ncbi:ketosynthase, partial [Acaromyces ingoldii]